MKKHLMTFCFLMRAILLGLTMHLPLYAGEDPVPLVLGKYLGEWRMIGLTTTPEDPVGVKTDIVYKTRWILGKSYLEVKSEGPQEALKLLSYDEKKRCFRSWWFSNKGDTADGIGIWNEQTQTLTWKINLPESIVAIGKERFQDDNTIDIEVVFGRDGQAVKKAKAEMRRIR